MPVSRSKALIIKELRQMRRDKSTLTLGIILPLLLLFLFGFGLSLDVDNVPVTVVRDTASPATGDLFISLNLSAYIGAGEHHAAGHAFFIFPAHAHDTVIRICDSHKFHAPCPADRHPAQPRPLWGGVQPTHLPGRRGLK